MTRYQSLPDAGGLPASLHDEVLEFTRRWLSRVGVVNVPVIARDLWTRNPNAATGIEDIEWAVLSAAQQLDAIIEFDRNHDSRWLPQQQRLAAEAS